MKNNMPLRARAFAMLILPILFAGCSRTAPIYDVAAAPIPPEQQAGEASTESGASPSSTNGSQTTATNGLSAEQVHDAIREAATDKGWIVMEDDACRFILKLDINRHTALVNVDYTPTSYNITYEDSVLLMYDGSNIHRNYNLWVKTLQEEIDRRLVDWMVTNRRAGPDSGGASAGC